MFRSSLNIGIEGINSSVFHDGNVNIVFSTDHEEMQCWLKKMVKARVATLIFVKNPREFSIN